METNHVEAAGEADVLLFFHGHSSWRIEGLEQK
jgi:hypothetical protein